jgi:hypothetical protein
MRRVVSFVSLLATVSVLAGCGENHATSAGSGRVAPATTATHPAAHPHPRLSDRALAGGALVRVADLAPGWRRFGAAIPDLRCSSRPFQAAHAGATTERLTLENTSIQERVEVFSSVAASRKAFARLNDPVSIACLRRTAYVRMSEQTEGPPTRPQLARTESLGSSGRAIRFTATAPSQIGVVHGVIDAVHVRVGRGVGALAIVSGPTIVSEEAYEAVVAAFQRRLRAALGSS